jgi:hypothetical protein
MSREGDFFETSPSVVEAALCFSEVDAVVCAGYGDYLFLLFSPDNGGFVIGAGVLR